MGLARPTPSACASQSFMPPGAASSAVCAGEGGSVFEGCPTVDLLLTGEMRHHDVLARVSAGTSVILTDHTHTERGYLKHLAKYLSEAVGADSEVVISASDKDPLSIR